MARSNNSNTDAWEKVQLTRLSGTTYVITSLKSGKNLQCQGNGACVFANGNEGQWEKWTVETRGDALFFVSQRAGNVLQCAVHAGRDGTVRDGTMREPESHGT